MKEEFYKLLEQLISENHFSKIKDGQFELKQHFEQPGPVMNINGRVVHGQVTPIELVRGIIIRGDGYCSNMDDSHKQEFSQINFFITQNGEYHMNVDVCIYYDDQEELTNIFNHFIQ